MSNPFRYYKTSPEVIRLAVLMYVRFPLSLRQVEDLLHERGIDISYETVRAWWNRFGPMFAKEIKKKRLASMHGITQWWWHLDEVFVRINGETPDLELDSDIHGWLGRDYFLFNPLIVEQTSLIVYDAILVVVEPDGIRVAPNDTDLAAVWSVQCIA